jgi:F-type H+-transporting ATPase subunit a
LALAVRLFGNMMSGAKVVAIIVALVPPLFPAVMNAFGLLTGMIQAYIFAVLAMVYIASATEGHTKKSKTPAAESTELQTSTGAAGTEIEGAA